MVGKNGNRNKWENELILFPNVNGGKPIMDWSFYSRNILWWKLPHCLHLANPLTWEKNLKENPGDLEVGGGDGEQESAMSILTDLILIVRRSTRKDRMKWSILNSDTHTLCWELFYLDLKQVGVGYQHNGSGKPSNGNGYPT